MFEVKVVSNDFEMEQVLSIRKTVFVEEQLVSIDIEIDEFENTATHFLLLKNKKPIGASRTREVDGYIKMERVCILQNERKEGAGAFLMKFMHDYCKEKGYIKSKLNSQKHAEPFYKKLGYETVSDEFLDAGIPHVTMIKNL